MGEKDPPFAPSNTVIALVATLLTVLTSSLSLLTTASKHHDDGDGNIYDYDSATIPLFSEATKLFVSLALLYRQMKFYPDSVRMTMDWNNMRLFPLPSLIYLIHNNIQFIILRYVDPSDTTIRVMANLKIIATGIFLRVLLQRKLSVLQWLALMLLMVAAISSQLTGCGGTLFSSPALGYILGTVSATLAGLAGVYTEYLMKMNDESLHWQNTQLYGCGLVLNAIYLGFHRWGSGNGYSAIFEGYSFVTVAIVLNLAASGLVVSWLLKFADNIVKLYATSMAMVVTMVVSLVALQIVPSIQLIIGITIAIVSLQLYFSPPQPSDLGSPAYTLVPSRPAAKT